MSKRRGRAPRSISTTMAIRRSPSRSASGPSSPVRTLDSLDNRVQFASSDAPFTADIPVDWPFLVREKAVVHETTTAKTYGELLPPHRTVLQNEGREGTRFPMSVDAVNPKHSRRFARTGEHLVVVECPFAHEADLFGNDAVKDEFGIFGSAQVLFQEWIGSPDLCQS